MESSFHMEEPVPDPNDYTTKEEEERNKTMLRHLKEQQAAHRKFVKQVELEQQIKLEREEEQRRLELTANKAYLDRRNALAKQRSAANNERMQKLLSKVDNYMHQINKLDSIEKIKRDAEREYIAEVNKDKNKPKVTADSINRLSSLNNKNTVLREVNKQKRKERVEENNKKKEKIAKANVINEKIQTILTKGFVNTQKIESHSLFQEEQQGSATCMTPDALNYNTSPIIGNTTMKKTTKYLPVINENADFAAEDELRQILKHDKNNMKALLNFKQKHKNFDISPYLHTAQMNRIKSAGAISTTTLKANKTTILSATEEVKYPSYLIACKHNNSEHVQAHLLNAKDDVEVYSIVNEKDEFDRNGLMYLIIHQNLTMIKLTLLSGVILSDSIDIYGRNIVHYCSLIDNDQLLDVLCHCIVFEYKEDFKGMSHYVEKCLQINSGDEAGNDEAALAAIATFDSLVENKDLAVHVNKQKEEEERKAKEEREERERANDPYVISLNKKASNQGSLIVVNNSTLPKKPSYKTIVKAKKVSIKKLINSADIDGNCPIHYIVKNNDLEKIEVLVYFKARLDVFDSQGKLPIDLATSSVIQQYLLKNEKSINSKANLSATNKATMKASEIQNITMNNNNLSTATANSALLNMNKLKYYSSEQINSFRTGYEGNTYLILSVIQNNFDMFRFLLSEKDANVLYQNSNGWTVLHFIVQNQNYAFFSHLFNITPLAESAESLFNSLNSKQLFDKRDIFKTKTELTYTGQALKSIDLETNNNLNLLTMAIDTANSLHLLQALMILYSNLIHFFSDSSPLDIVFNRQYGKSKQPLLIKSIERKSKAITQFLLKEDIVKQYHLDTHQGDIHNANLLHYAVKNKDKEMIQYLTRYDAESNLLRTTKDSKGKVPSDYDISKVFTYELAHVWDGCVRNDHHLLEKLVNELKYYGVNDQLPLSKNTPLHLAAYHMSDKACLFLVNNQCDATLLNRKSLKASEVIKDSDKAGKAFKAKFNKILNKTITAYIDLELKPNENASALMNKTNSSALNHSRLSEEMVRNKHVREIIDKMKEAITSKKINMSKVFRKLDKNNNGTLEGSEFECFFLVLDIPGINKDDILLVNSYLDKDKNGLIDYEEFVQIINN